MKPFAGAIVRHAREDEEVVRGDDMEGEMIVKEDVEHRPPPVTLGPSPSGASAPVRRVPSHPRMKPGMPGLSAPKPPSPGADPAARLGPRHASPAGGTPEVPAGTPSPPPSRAVRVTVFEVAAAGLGLGLGLGLQPRAHSGLVAVLPGAGRARGSRRDDASVGGIVGGSNPAIAAVVQPQGRAGAATGRSPGAGSPDSVDISRAMRTDPNLNPGARDDDDSRQFSVSDISGDVSVGKSP